MNKTSIKVIKRKDQVVAASVQTRNLRESKQSAAVVALGEEKTERWLYRKMADTVSSWIAERRKNKRREEMLAIRNLYGSESLFGKTI